ncbi:M24 family metallopeptidase [Pseudotenacibaculum sp. MALMAid0570]|uniref:M24 family metallopeptidase n=1 Tax=Pseudotenacibaculum sp. MALMAid0570 TaxID=3143938 RepID=UPI0032DEFCE2
MRNTLLLSFLFFTSIVFSQIVSERDRAAIKDELLEDRFQNLLPQLMDDAKIDMWLIISREYNEDPVMKTMLPANWLNARRRTMMVFYRDQKNDTIERLAVARYDIGKSIKSAWQKEKQPNQWKALVDIISERNPKKIGINYSTHFPLADGLVKTDYEELKQNLPDSLESRLVSAEKLSIGWIETRTEKEMKLFKKLVKITHDIIDEAFSSKVIVPGKTTTDDVVWWMRQKVTDLGLETWFHPTIDVQRTKEELKSHIYSFTKREKEKIIQKGDLLHCDFGITYIGLNTDCQQHAYVLHDNEKEVPEYLKKAFKKGNRLQDIMTTNMKKGKTGNEILLSSLSQAKKEGLKPAIYSHPLGKYGHSAGTTIGMWDSQGGVPVRGDYPLHKNTVYAIELNVTVNIPEWQKNIRIMLEEAGFFGDNYFEYVNERQTAIKPIKTN